MKNHFVALIVLFLLPIGVLAQDLPTIIPPSPEAASLGKFTEVPISHYTGLPNISVPIASYEVGGKSFSVSISYHARGVRVEEMASRVGIGWALNAGGQISRQTRDQPDDGPGGYINRPNVLMDNLGVTLPDQGFFENQNIRDLYASADTHNEYKPDRHPDQFNLQVGSLSAKFIFDYNDDTPLIQSYSDVNISYGLDNNNKLASFVVTDKDGFKYYFGVSKNGTAVNAKRNYDKNIGNYAIQVQGGYTLTQGPTEISYNSWPLMNIESPNGELVSFVYEEQTSEFFRRSYDEYFDNSNIVCHATKNLSYQFQLKEIQHSNGKIEFESNDLRQDFGNSWSSKELDKVKIYDSNDTFINSFQLYQSYPDTVLDNNQNAQLIALDATGSKRLRLDSIQESGLNGIKKPPYAFLYNSQKLPNRFSNSQDLWGYYNGANNGSFLLYYSGVRTVNEDASMAGMLEKITYPTGGSTKFTYEHNRGVLGMEYDHISFPLVNPTEFRSEGLSHLGSSYYSNDRYAKDIVINDVFGQITFNVTLPTINGINHNVACANPIQNDCGFQISLEGINGTQYNYYNIYAGTTQFAVEAGEYRLIVDPDSSLNWNPNPPNVSIFSVNMSWNEQPISQDELLYSSGKRVKKIEFFDSGNNLISNKEYSYQYSSGGESGEILSIPFFGSLHPIFTITNFNIFEVGSAVPGSPFSTYQGNTIGYKSVTEYYGDANNNHGKTEYEFVLNKDTDDFSSYPITPPTDNEWLRGLPKYIRTFKNDNGLYKKVKDVKNDYAFAENYLLPLIFTPVSHRQGFFTDWTPPTSSLIQPGLLYEKTDTFYRLPLINLFYAYRNDGSVNTNDLSYKIYHFTGGTLGNITSTETLYDENENATLITETETGFNYDKHYQPSMVTSVTSDGIPIIQTFTYPQELVSNYIIHPANYSNDPIMALAEQNRFVPIETKTYRDDNLDGYPGFAAPDELKSTTKTTYDWFAGNTILEPTLIQTAIGTQPLIDRIEFKDYDADGNIRQVAKANGMNITYIHGYNNTLPVAKIENATYAEVNPFVLGIKNASNSDDSSCMSSESCNENALRNAQNNLRNGLPNAMITTYTYDPLIGITSMTDPKGYTVYYEYDDLNRLVRVKDEDGKIMSENAYHYLLDN